MSQSEVERFLGRIMTDADFREKSARSMDSACYNEGFVLSSVEMTLLHRLDFSQLGHVAELLDDSLRRK